MQPLAMNVLRPKGYANRLKIQAMKMHSLVD
jgi:hypothetical protein